MMDSSLISTTKENKRENNWIGRFAPSPSGQLHFGSLIAALGSYLIAKQNNGKWLLRIEDIDPPREVEGAAKQIIQTLENFGFEWDGEILYQSQRNLAYQQAIDSLYQQKLIYYCKCSRKQIQQRNQGVYDQFCLNRQIRDPLAAMRIKFNDAFSSFNDEIKGACCFSQPADLEDFIVKRRDGLHAYQLAVVIDDIDQGVNHVVRGADLLDSTPRQNFLYHLLNHQPPRYYHLPLVVDADGNKLSKSKFSPAIESHKASYYLCKALAHLGQKVEEGYYHISPKEILKTALQNWQLNTVPKQSVKHFEVNAN
ncbi:MAG: tRNA glutamyl-Q(34) synthetase GluQRS [Gammaproteobacteria bacterium]|nr:tRNA glutamyl-Q(34) synthetase GluQRS [Gammaproteobacteria bacterium]MDH5628604.1 tRNA glutamyl-Q(34) synthetase GluQRS [Gammaproteobacteria bacterium]